MVVDPVDDGRLSSHSAKGPVPVDLGEAPRAAVIGENTGRDMPDMRVPADAPPSASSSGGVLMPRQVIAATIAEASASMQEQSSQQNGAQIGSRARSSQPSLIPNGKHGGAQVLRESLQSHRVGSPLIAPQKAGSSIDD